MIIAAETRYTDHKHNTVQMKHASDLLSENIGYNALKSTSKILWMLLPQCFLIWTESVPSHHI